eukprot:m.319323 g.319323  ORF g.319323 m.319323 type:complete len:182 (-) comp20301_c0_seq11:3065-3610(-)
MPEIWMGECEQWMDEGYLMQLFHSKGFQCRSAKRIRDRTTGLWANYCFIDFENAQVAEAAVTAMNGTPMPDNTPPKNFKLNWGRGGNKSAATAKPFDVGMSASQSAVRGPSHSVFVGDLTPDVTDLMITRFFQEHYKSVKVGTVQKDESGRGKGDSDAEWQLYHQNCCMPACLTICGVYVL